MIQHRERLAWNSYLQKAPQRSSLAGKFLILVSLKISAIRVALSRFLPSLIFHPKFPSTYLRFPQTSNSCVWNSQSHYVILHSSNLRALKFWTLFQALLWNVLMLSALSLFLWATTEWLFPAYGVYALVLVPAILFKNVIPPSENLCHPINILPPRNFLHADAQDSSTTPLSLQLYSRLYLQIFKLLWHSISLL